MRIPTELITHCPKCEREMEFNLFWDDTFVLISRDIDAVIRDLM